MMPSEREAKPIEVNVVQIVVRVVAPGRQGRIAIEAPAGAVFSANDDRAHI